MHKSIPVCVNANILRASLICSLNALSQVICVYDYFCHIQYNMALLVCVLPLLFLHIQAVMLGNQTVSSLGLGYNCQSGSLSTGPYHQLRPLLEHLIKLLESAGTDVLQDEASDEEESEMQIHHTGNHHGETGLIFAWIVQFSILVS